MPLAQTDYARGMPIFQLAIYAERAYVAHNRRPSDIARLVRRKGAATVCGGCTTSPGHQRAGVTFTNCGGVACSIRSLRKPLLRSADDPTRVRGQEQRFAPSRRMHTDQALSHRLEPLAFGLGEVGDAELQTGGDLRVLADLRAYCQRRASDAAVDCELQ